LSSVPKVQVTNLSPADAPTRATKALVFIVNAQVVGKPQPLFSSKTPNRIASITTAVTNSGNIYIGGSDVDEATHSQKMPADSSIDYTIDDLSKVYYIGDTLGDVFYVNWEWGIGQLTD